MRIIRLAFRNLARNRRRTSLALLTIAAGVGAVICLNGFVTGFLKIMVESQVRSRLGDLQIVSDSPEGAGLREGDPRLLSIIDVPGVESMTHRLHFVATAMQGDVEVPVVGIGVVPSSENRVCPQAASEIEPGGSGLGDNDQHLALVSSDLLENLGFGDEQAAANTSAIGKSLRLLVAGALPQGNIVQIQGVQRSLFAFDSRGFLLTTLRTAQDITRRPGEITEVAVRIVDGYDQADVKRMIKVSLGSSYKVKDWRESQPFLNEAVGRSQAVLGAICIVLLVIVAFGIANTMQMNVHERTREIGTLAAIGLSAMQIAGIFLAEAVVLGFIGSVLGVLFGATGTLLFREVGIELPKLAVLGVKILRPEWPLSTILPALGATMLSSLLAGVTPAMRAARLNPIDALRAT